MQPDHITRPKVCRKCEQAKPATTENFSRLHYTSDGLQSYCKACMSAYRKRWGAENAERRAEYDRSEKGKAIHAKANRKWVSLHRQTKNAVERNRRAREKEAEGTHTAADIEAQYTRQKGRCYYCNAKLGKKYHVEHIVPLSRGGTNWPENLVVACPKCNESKGAKLPHEWPEGGRLL